VHRPQYVGLRPDDPDRPAQVDTVDWLNEGPVVTPQRGCLGGLAIVDIHHPQPFDLRAQLLLLRGAPGVGKTHVARCLGEQIGTGAILEVDRFRAMFVAVDWSSRVQHDAALLATMAAARALVVAGVSPVVVVDNFGRDSATRALTTLEDITVDRLVVSLWVEEATLRDRLDARGGGFQDRPLAALMNTEVYEMRIGGDLLVDTTGQSPEDVAGIIMDILAGTAADACIKQGL